ncbi:hypothetical protein D6C13_02185 [Rahnella woolbedingensis]|uniref:Lipoprotein n=1 Tax=Rahnella woolbedingensis TaxID=1510574 RepID=A0A419NEL5_9GAMM|nr:hypothetical protein D6C13_02185 [Rahnella woolbedingensis]
MERQHEKIIGIALICVALAGCTDPERAEKVLADNGFTNIHIGGYSWAGCSNGDNYATEFDATSPAGKQVNGVVCSAWLKGSTIRFFD